MSQDNNHDEWLSLIEISGPFLAVPVLKKAFPQGLEAVDGRVRKYLRQAYDEWCEARDNDDPQLEELHHAWIREVLARGLEYDEKDSGELLKRGEAIPATLRISLPEHGVTLSPDYALVNGQNALLLIQTYPADTDLDAAISQQGWVATPAERMVQLCRTTGCRLGLVTNGERWLLIDAPVGSVVTYASWYARLWGQEPLTLQAFLTLLGIRRFFVDASEQLPALFDESLQHQEEVTDALGEQVRRAVEVLIQSLDKEDLNSARTLLQDVAPTQLYEAGLTIMMRLVFLLSAEERGLLLMGDEAYEANYAISTLRMQLRKESDEVLERRHDAWARLLATFRAVYSGIEHEALRLPALGGSLFDPDRFPFLEGRPTGSSWRTDDARPLPIDNRTVLLLLEAIQQYQGRTLSYRALDVEQIGYVYEGLLERTVKRTDAVTVELVGGKGAKKTIHAVSELEALRGRDKDEFTRQLASSDALKRSESAIRKDLARVVDAALTNHLLTACHGDEALRDRLLPIANLLRTDPWGYPLVYAKGAFIVTTGSDRRETGTHYTPKSLTEAIVAETLTPVAYVGPAEGTPREQWALKSPAELLDLKICDPAMGSGAFLVQACRWLSDRLVESWSQVEASGKKLSVNGEMLEAGAPDESLPRDSEARTVIARRLIAERCLYGVDLNPLAVELAKLSIWLVTLAKGRPFGFLDHNLRCGDSLLGIHRLEQLTELSMTPTGKGQLRLFGQNIEHAVHAAIELRLRLREVPIRDIHDVEFMAQLDAKARQKLEVSERIADALVGIHFSANNGNGGINEQENRLATLADEAIRGNEKENFEISELASYLLTERAASKSRVRKPFHWPLEFPEVFSGNERGFDVVIGNPPFLWALRISIRISIEYSHFLKRAWPHAKKNADLCAYFFLRSDSILRKTGCLGLIATNTISEADTRETSLDFLLEKGGSIYAAKTNIKWPGVASVRVSAVCISKKTWSGTNRLDGNDVDSISSSLVSARQSLPPEILTKNKERCFKGSVPLGDGFFISEQLAEHILSVSPIYSRVIYRYINGEELNNSPVFTPGRWVIYFSDWSLDECEKYPLAFDVVKKHVKPVRDKIIPTNGMARQRRDLWWKFTGPTVNLYRAVESLDRVLVGSAVSKHHALGFVSSKYVYSNALNVFAFDDYQHFAILQSSMHSAWALAHGSKLEDRPRYNVSDCFETFPLPSNFSSRLENIGERYYMHRQAMMLERNEGMTKIYNRIHDKADLSSDVVMLRNLMQEMDEAVLGSYGFDDVNLSHEFQELKSGTRFAINDSARKEVLEKLSELNRKRYEEELEVGLHLKAKARSSIRAPRAAETIKNTSFQPSLNLEPGVAVTCNSNSNSNSNSLATVILNFLSTHDGWYSKANVLAATGITDGQWNAKIADLIADSKVERQGERRGARYRFIGEAD